MKDKANAIKKEYEEKKSSITSIKILNDVRVEYLGKQGKITELSKMMKDVPNDQKKEFGMLVNEVRNFVTENLDEIKEKLEKDALDKKLESEKIDITLPSKKIKRGSKHPMTRIEEKFEDLFLSMGYTIYDGPEVESDENCFQKLNLPKGHAARDAQDTFYLKDEFENYLLRSQTSTAQVRAMEENKEKGPIRIVCPGKVYRRDEDATHSHQFMQIEGLLVDKNIHLTDLKGTFEIVAKRLFGNNIEVRLKPSYYRFTEPSVELDISCFNCKGKGCAICKNSGYITVAGAGMVHPNVLRNCGYDPAVWSGFAFGFGAERLAMLKYGITDIRTFYMTDLRCSKTFDRKEDNND